MVEKGETMPLYLVYRTTSFEGSIHPWSTRKEKLEAGKDKKECLKHWNDRGFGGVIKVLEIPDVDEVARVTVSRHAIDRFRERTGCRPDRSDSHVRKRIRGFWEQGKPAELLPEHSAAQILRHGLENEAEYRLYDQIVLVMVADEIKTIHFNESKRWVVKE